MYAVFPTSSKGESISVKDITGGSASKALQTFFGQPADVYNTTAYDQQSVTTHDLPKAYLGRNLFIGDLVTLLVVTGDSWYTREALPWKQTQQLGAKWNETVFNQHFTSVVPHEGVSRLVSQKFRSRSVTFLRRGLGAKIEHGFWRTEEGIRNWKMNLAQIASASQETANMGVIQAYLTADNFELQWERDHGTFRSMTIADRLKYEKRFWAITQLEKNGFQKLNQQIIESMNRYQGRADMWILPSRLRIYLNLVPPEKTDYYLAGPDGPARIRQSDAVLPRENFDRTTVRFTRHFDVLSNGSIDPLKRQRMIGEHNFMIDRFAMNGGNYALDYTSHCRSIQIYDEDGDAWHVINLSDVLDHVHRFDGHGSLRLPKTKHRVPNYNDDLKQDFLLMPDGQGGLRNIECFGHMREEHMSVRSIINLSKTLCARIYNQYRGGEKEVNDIIKKGLQAYDQLSLMPLTVEYFQGLRREAIVKSNPPNISGALIDRNEDDRLWRGRSMKEWRVDPSTDTMFLEKNELANLKAGYANWNGLKMLDNFYLAATEPLSSTNVRLPLVESAHNFVNLVEGMANGMRRILLDSMFLDPRHTAPQFHRATIEHVIAANLFGMQGVALWLADINSDAVNPAGAVTLQTRLYALDDETDLRIERFRNRESNLTSLIDQVFDISYKTQEIKIPGDPIELTSETDRPQRNQLLLKLVGVMPGALGSVYFINEEQKQRRQSLVHILEKMDVSKGPDNAKQFLQQVMMQGNTSKATEIVQLGSRAWAFDGAYLQTIQNLPRPQSAFSFKLIRNWLLKNKQLTTLRTTTSVNAFMDAIDAEMTEARRDDGEHIRNKIPAWASWFNLTRIFKEGKISGDDPADTLMDALGRVGSTIGTRFPGETATYTPTTEDRYGRRFYRTPLTLSPEQILILAEAAEADDPLFSEIRVSTFNNPDTPADAIQIKQMAKRIRLLMAGDETLIESTPGFLFPRNIRHKRGLLQTPISHQLEQLQAIMQGGGPGIGGKSRQTTRLGAQMSFPSPTQLAMSKPTRAGLWRESTESGAGSRWGARRGLQEFDVGAGGPKKRQLRTMEGAFSPGSGVGALFAEQNYPAEQSGDLHKFRQEMDIHWSMDKSASISGEMDPRTPLMNQNFRDLFRKVSGSSNSPLEIALARAYLGTPLTLATLKSFVEHDILLPMGFIISRPHARYDMYMGIKALAGAETGRTFVGHGDAQVFDDANVKVHYINYTYYSRSVVLVPRNVRVVPDIHAAGTRGGLGSEWIDSSHYQPRAGRFGNGSMFAFAIPYEERKFPNPLDCSGRFKQYYSDGLMDKDNMKELLYSTAAFYNGFWGFVTAADVGQQEVRPEYNEGPTPVNTTTWLGHTNYWNNTHKGYTDTQANTGHWGPEVAPNYSRKLRQGELVELVKQNYKTVAVSS